MPKFDETELPKINSLAKLLESKGKNLNDDNKAFTKNFLL